MTTVTASQDIIASLGRNKDLNAKQELDSQSRFLKLLTTQLQNQDPLNPVDNAQTTSQLAQISTVDGVERLNATLEKLVGSYKSNETLQAAALVGRQVMLEGNKMGLHNGAAIGGVHIDGPADEVVVSIKDANGIEVATMNLGELEAGSHVITWDGKTNNDTVAANGTYTLSVKATRGDEKVTSRALQMSTVTNVVTGGNEVQIDVGSLGRVSLGDVRMIL